jgi:Lon protease-like protein
MEAVPMFPLGSVLLPHMPLALRLFEPRYLMMLGQLLDREHPEFGVVLIERGHEVGGGDHRFPVGTFARIVQVEAARDHIALTARGDRRFRVVEWLPDDPYPQAMIEELPELVWDDALAPMRETAEAAVRRALAARSEFEQTWPADLKLSEAPLEACWQLAGIAPVSAMDHLAALGADSLRDLLERTESAARETSELDLGWGGE